MTANWPPAQGPPGVAGGAQIAGDLAGTTSVPRVGAIAANDLRVGAGGAFQSANSLNFQFRSNFSKALNSGAGGLIDSSAPSWAIVAGDNVADRFVVYRAPPTSGVPAYVAVGSISAAGLANFVGGVQANGVNVATLGSDAKLLTAQRPWASGLLASRPSASTVGQGYRYFATDDSGGTEYFSDGTNWILLGPKIELGFSNYTVDSSMAGPTTQALSDPTLTVTSRGLPYMVDTHLMFTKDSTAGYIWAFLTVSGSSTGVLNLSAFQSCRASEITTCRPQARISDPVGTSRTLTINYACGAGQAKLMGGFGGSVIRAEEY